jgi:hypothetical protein
MFSNPQLILDKLLDLQRLIRTQIISSRHHQNLHDVDRTTEEDTIYKLDLLIEPLLDDFFTHWSRALPLIVIAEGLDPQGRVYRQNPHDQPQLRIILDPIDGTRGLMYDKRSAWSLAAAAPNLGPATRLSHIELAVMTELPTSKMSHSDVLWAIKNQGTNAQRQSILDSSSTPLNRRPSQSSTIAHGFASIANFFPGTKLLAAQLSEFLAEHLLPKDEVDRAILFEDQYISTGGQLYELIAGHDRFTADLRPLFYQIQKKPPGVCVHPYDICTALIAQESGVILTNGLGQALDAPLDLTTPVSFAAFANESLRKKIEPLLMEFFRTRLDGKH